MTSAAAERFGEIREAPERALRVIEFIELLTVPSGVGSGRPFKLRKWQRKFIFDIYGKEYQSAEQWFRVVRRAILSIGRKNGKTALLAALVLVHLCGPEAVRNGEIYSAANDREQAAQVFKFVAQIVRADDDLLDMLRIVDSTKTINCPHNGSFYKAMSAEAGTKHGLNPVLVIFDELAQAKSRELFDVLDSSMGAQAEALFVTISTQSRDPLHILSELIDDGLSADDPSIVCHLYEVPLDVEDIFDEECWYLANPALGDFRLLEDMRALAAKAKRMPSEEPKFRNLYLNQRVSMHASLISRPEWMALHSDGPLIEPGEEVYAGLDLSSVNDLTSLVLVSAEDGDRITPFLWKPELLLEEHSDRDFGKGNHQYILWNKEGHLRTTPGKTIDFDFIAEEIAEIAGLYDIRALAYDRWRIKELLRSFERIGFEAAISSKDEDVDGLRLVEWGQGYRDMAPAIDALERSVMSDQLRHDGNPAMTWCMANAVSTSDPAGNRKLDKDAARFRIDGAQALCQGLGIKYRDLTETDDSYLNDSEVVFL